VPADIDGDVRGNLAAQVAQAQGERLQAPCGTVFRNVVLSGNPELQRYSSDFLRNVEDLFDPLFNFESQHRLQRNGDITRL
jgi:hypothetical protein